MKTLDFSAKFKGTDGKETETTLNKNLAELLASETSGPALKLLGWVEALHETGKLSLDEADTKLLEDIVEKSTRMAILLKGQLLRVFLNK